MSVMKNVNLVKAALYAKLDARKSINLPSDENFGFEIELEGLDYLKAEQRVKRIDSRFKCCGDQSLDDFGLEIATPVLRNNKEDLQLLKKLSNALTELNPKFDNCSFQVNLDDKFNFDEKVELFKLYCYFEKVIYIFSKGYDQKLRHDVDVYAMMVYNDFIFEYYKFKNNPELMLCMFTNMKKYGLNLKTAKKLVEFRTPNGNTNYELWLNYVNTFYHILKTVKNGRYDKELVDDYIVNYNKYKDETFTLFNHDFNLDMDKCLEFVNLIFDDDMDKIYFLKQLLTTKQEIAKEYVNQKKLPLF